MKFTYYTIIGKDNTLLEGHLSNIVYHAGFDKIKDNKELIVIIYKNNKIPDTITSKLISTCNKYNAKHFIYNEPTNSFLDNLYKCWNLGYEYAEDGLVFRGGSDQVFSKDSFLKLNEIAQAVMNDDVILQANTIENIHRAHMSRHIVTYFGDNFNNFNLNQFESFCNLINKNVTEKLLDIYSAKKYWNKPTSLSGSIGTVERTDGCSWLMKKSDWLKYGPLEPINKQGITGDVTIHDKLQVAGFKNYIVRDCITYHFVRGESLSQYQ